MRPTIDLTGRTFGKLTVLSFSHRRGKSFWNCRCECGTEKVVGYGSLVDGSALSCGCLRRENIQKINQARKCDGHTNHPLYRTWASLKRAGLLCPEWEDFHLFSKQAPPKPSPDHIFGRSDPSASFSLQNALWLSHKEWSDRQPVKRYRFRGSSHTLSEVSLLTGISRSRLYHALKRGLSLDQAVSG